MSKRKIAFTLPSVALLTMLAGIASGRAFPFKGGAVATPPGTAQGKPKVYNATDKGVIPPTVIFNPEPPETKAPRAGKPKEIVVLEIVVGVDGAVTDVKVIQGFDKGLTTKAVDFVKTWKFKPAKKDGMAVLCKLMVEVSFWRK